MIVQANLYEAKIEGEQSLNFFAYAIAGPRDFLLNLAINTAIPWYLLQNQTSVTWLGNPSILSLFAPMGFILVAFTTFFGLFNGLSAGKISREILVKLFKQDRSWLLPALKTSVLYGLVSLFGFLAFIYFFAWSSPETSFAKNSVIWGQGLLAAVLAYAVQVNGILAAKNLKTA